MAPPFAPAVQGKGSVRGSKRLAVWLMRLENELSPFSLFVEICISMLDLRLGPSLHRKSSGYALHLLAKLFDRIDHVRKLRLPALSCPCFSHVDMLLLHRGSLVAGSRTIYFDY